MRILRNRSMLPIDECLPALIRDPKSAIRNREMLTHIVIWKYKDEVEQPIRDEHVNLLRRLASIIDELESLQVGFDVLQLPRSYDTGLVATFKDRAGLEAYTVHPEHVKAADFGRNISAHVASVDFES